MVAEAETGMSPPPFDWSTCRAGKVQTAAQAVQGIRRGQRVFIGSGCAEPQRLVQALAARGNELADTQIIHLLTLGTAPYVDPRLERGFRHNAFFIGANVREAVADGRADFTPIFLSEIPALFRRGQIPVDVALISVSPPDERGWCSYGVSIDVVKAATECARTVVAEVNPNMPRVHGDSFVHVDRLDVLVASDAPTPRAADTRAGRGRAPDRTQHRRPRRGRNARCRWASGRSRTPCSRHCGTSRTSASTPRCSRTASSTSSSAA